METIQCISICFLVLHYMNAELTLRTIESVLELHSFGNSQIVVVDNASPNDSGKLLQQKYKGMNQIHIILSKSNTGFSAGNNLGFQYIKEKFNPDFVIVINNDILFPQKEFINKLYALYMESPFWVAGPDIYVPNRDYHSSPMHDHSLSEQEVKRLMEKSEWQKRQFAKRFSLYGFNQYLGDRFEENTLIKIVFKLKRFILGQKKNYRQRNEEIVLQGSCLIFDKRYCLENDKLFLPLTFMYGEEEILTLQCIRNNWQIRYFPELIVWHSGDAGLKHSKLSYGEYCKKRVIKLDGCQEARKLCMKLFYKNG